MKGWGTLILTGIGAFGGYFIGRECGKTEQEKKEYGIAGLLIGAGAGLGSSLLIDNFTKEEHDTVNYTFHHKRRRVYDGICYEDRLDARINEHIRGGKTFDKVVSDKPKPRSAALNLERKRIKRFTPKYNIQHNKVA